MAIILGLGLLFTLACLVIHLLAPWPKKEKSVFRYFLAAFCSTSSSGNLCGLGGVFGVGPLLSGLCISGYAFFWLKGARNAP